jgi:hypothetical protein
VYGGNMMSYYVITPFGEASDSLTAIVEQVEQGELESILKDVYQEIISDTYLYDFSVEPNQEDVIFVFASLSDFQKAANLLDEQHIPYQTSTVEETCDKQFDLQTPTRKFRTLKTGEPDMDGLDNLELKKMYESE